MIAVHIIHNDDEHAAALRRAEEVWNAPVGSPEFEELELLGTLIDDYERRRYPIEEPAPLEQVRSFLERGLLSRAELQELIEAA